MDSTGKEGRTDPGVLRRMMGERPPPTPDVDEMTLERAWRLGIVRGLSRAIDLTCTVTSYRTAPLPAADIVSQIEAGDLAVLLEGTAGFGAAVLDAQVLAAMIESQTMGRVLSRTAAPRPVTRTDAAMAADPLDLVLSEFEARAEGLNGAESAAALRFATLPSGPEALALALPDEPHVLTEIVLRLGDGERTGRMRFILPLPRAPDPESAEDSGPEWADGLERSVLASTVTLTAVLARLTMPVDAVARLAPGDLLMLNPKALSQVVMTGCTGQATARGRLGQSGGMKAVLLQDPDPPALSVLPE
ncbi:FliM/FliN family flagellar motor switch protein [Oceaniglobus indicus]|uniref:FliM/FliN family flagellar motor switch protein n=1 Tax=Oceaniglobus indicus TaxID=2047749 RepID=UPI000C19D7DC|nr:FliM/FliN family flagellar motor switch protein [Oceaniglobus indicus]